MECQDVSVDSLAATIHMSPRTLRGYLNGEHFPGNYMIVIAICIGLGLEYNVSEELLEKSGHPMIYGKMSNEMEVHCSALIDPSERSFDEWNKWFVENGSIMLETNPYKKL